MDWSELFDIYGWDDRAASDDALELAERIVAWAACKGVKIELTLDRLARQILRYVWMRQETGAYMIVGPRHTRLTPTGWTAHHERIWRDWIDHAFELETWNAVVMAPVFGTDVRSWEARIDGWRDELFTFLPTWIARSMTRFEEIDVTPLPEPEPEDVDPRTAKIDPYLLEHGRRGRRIKGVRTFD